MSYGVSLLFTGLVTARDNDKEEGEDGTGGNHTSSVTDICSEFYNETLAQEKQQDSVGHMQIGIHIALVAYAAATFVSAVGLKEVRECEERSDEARRIPRRLASFVRAERRFQ